MKTNEKRRERRRHTNFCTSKSILKDGGMCCVMLMLHRVCTTMFGAIFTLSARLLYRQDSSSFLRQLRPGLQEKKDFISIFPQTEQHHEKFRVSCHSPSKNNESYVIVLMTHGLIKSISVQ